MSVLYLLRHGQASLGTSDYDRLSPLGHRQAEQVAVRLAAADLAVSHVVAGRMRRQRDTATGAIQSLSFDPARIEIDARLDEYDHDSVLAAHTSAISFESAGDAANGLLQSSLDQAIRQWSTTGVGGSYPESHEAFVARIEAAMADLTERPGVTLVATSGGVIAVACARLLGLPVAAWVDLVRVVVNASLTKIVSGRTGSHLVSFNDHAHLEVSRELITYR